MKIKGGIQAKLIIIFYIVMYNFICPFPSSPISESFINVVGKRKLSKQPSGIAILPIDVANALYIYVL